MGVECRREVGWLGCLEVVGSCFDCGLVGEWVAVGGLGCKIGCSIGQEVYGLVGCGWEWGGMCRLLAC